MSHPVPLHTVCSVTAALQKVVQQTFATAEQRADEANWFRKIGNRSCAALQMEIHITLFIPPSAPFTSLELSSSVRERP